jgi:ABC-2 type transport system ATP-binding protein
MDAAILTEGLTKRFGDHTAVEHLDLEVAHGQIFGFLGPNGAGKTTTIGMLLGLIRPTAGRAYVLGFDVAHEPGRALAGVGAMIEAPAFYPYLSGRDNLRVLARAAGLPADRVDVVLGKVELAERARHKFHAYSQGMKQRLAIAAALLPDPRLIILDEPTNGLDPAGQLEIRQLIRELASSGHTIFLTSHLLHEVEQLCEKVAILRQGRLVVSGAVAELLRRGQGMFLRVAGDIGPAIELLRTVAWVRGVERTGDALVVDAPIERAAELTMLLAGRSIAVAEIRANEQRLEDFFLEVTRT